MATEVRVTRVTGGNRNVSGLMNCKMLIARQGQSLGSTCYIGNSLAWSELL